MYLKLAWRNIWRNKRRSYITIGSIMFAVILACMMRSMQLGSYERMIETAARFYTGYIQIHQKGYWDDQIIDNCFSYDEALIRKIADNEGVEEVVPRVESFALASSGQKTKGAMVLGIVPDREDKLTKAREKMMEGSYLDPGDRMVMVSEGLARYLNVQLGDTLVLLSQGYHGANAAGLYPIKGILKFPSPAQNNATIYMPLKEAQWFYNVDGRLTTLALVIDKARHTTSIASALQSKVDTSRLEVMAWQELMPDLVQSIEIDNISGKIMIWILYTVIGFGMFGTFLMMTTERKYEFGVMMAVGMKRVKMQFTIFLEMLMLTSVGVLTGLTIALPILIYYHHHPIYFSGEAAEAIEKFGVEAAYFFSIQPALFYNQAWVIFAMSVILGFYPLYVIHGMRPVEAMREA